MTKIEGEIESFDGIILSSSQRKFEHLTTALMHHTLLKALLDERRFIERDMQNTNVRWLGRENCASGIDIPPSDIQNLDRR